MRDKQIKIVGAHIAGCAAVRRSREGSWDNPWGPLAFGRYGEPLVTTRRRYGKSGVKIKTWIVFVCNDPDCAAQLHVEAGFILSAALADLEGK